MNKPKNKKETNDWYLIRKKGEKHWWAYQLSQYWADRLQPQYEKRGPFRSFLRAMISH